MKKLSYIIVILLLLTSVAAIGIGKEAGEQNEKTLMSQITGQVSVDFKKLEQPSEITNLAGNVLISSSEKDDIQPTITKDQSGKILVAFATKKSILEQTITLSYSEDESTFTDASEFSSDEGGILQYPSISVIPEAGDVGISFTDPLAEYPLTVWRIGDINDQETYNGVSYNWGETEDYEEVTVTYIHELFVPMLINHNYYLSDIPGCPYICYFLPDLEFPTEIGANYYDGQSILKTAPASNIDLATGQDYFYLLFEHDNETTGHSDIAFKKSVTDLELLYTAGGGPGGMDKYADIEAMPWQRYLIQGDFDAKDPSVGASGNNVVVVYMINDAGDWDIKCSYSNDDGETWETSTIADDHPADEVYPSVDMRGNTVYCTYIKEGNLILKKSEDSGANWGEPQQVNEEEGTVVEEPRAQEISEGGIVWTDTRNDNKDIYYAPGEPAPEILVESISGGFGVSAVIKNAGNAVATNVQWSLDVEGGLVITGNHADGTINSLAAGDSTTVKIPLVLGFGGITIKATADGATKSATGTLLLLFVVGVS